ncbi:PIN domain-containing protein [Nocardioides zeae]|uniref:Nucleic acid-binding protein n=1 Tax=Nocardioides zeae TaxID=1457234 RepID=A0AAJ1U2C0_9ACTN|nr:PIN domain-containing protein [Nocardioides zeae]MDQ1106064.1 putative nucleic acid-binding protein [Nocardioides zeae]
MPDEASRDESVAGVVIDTDVYSALYTDPERASRRGMAVEQWREVLQGTQVLISFQTRAEVMAGMQIGNWGESRKVAAMAKLDSAPTIPADIDVIRSYADLTAACRLIGHALQAKIHSADRWVAASALAKGLPLLSGDRVYRDTPGLRLLG